jgi:hypothetical protein
MTEVWPENWDAVRVILRLETQWRVSMGGPTGLVYDSLPFWLEIEAVPRAAWPQVTQDVQVLEGEMLRLIRSKG